MYDKNLIFFPRNHNYYLNLMCKSVQDTNYARLKADTPCDLRLIPSNSTMQADKTWALVLWALWKWLLLSLHIMLIHFSTETRLLLNRQRMKNVCEAKLEDVKPTAVKTLTEQSLHNAKKHLCPKTVPFFPAVNTTGLRTSLVFKNYSK